MAMFEDLQRQAGMPKSPAVPGGPPLPSKPNGFVASPMPASAPIGRPPSGPPPFPAGSPGPALPITPGAASTAAQPASQGSRPPSSGGGNSAAAAPVPGTAEAAAAGDVFYQSDHVPDLAEIAGLPEGLRIMTPYGEMTRDGNLIPNPQAAQAYQMAVVQAREKFGPHPWAGLPNAPQPPIKLGRSWINPFTGSWGKA